MAKTITEQIADLQNENERLKELDKLFEKAVKNEFGLDRKQLHKLVQNREHFQSDFEKKICSFFGLKTAEERDLFLTLICTEKTVNYLNRITNSDNVNSAE